MCPTLTPATLLNPAISFRRHLPHLHSRIERGQSLPPGGNSFLPGLLSGHHPVLLPPTCRPFEALPSNVCCKLDQLSPPRCCHGLLSWIITVTNLDHLIATTAPVRHGLLSWIIAVLASLRVRASPCPTLAHSHTIVRVIFSTCKSGHVPSAQ